MSLPHGPPERTVHAVFSLQPQVSPSHLPQDPPGLCVQIKEPRDPSLQTPDARPRAFPQCGVDDGDLVHHAQQLICAPARKLPLPPWPPEHPGSWVGRGGWPGGFPPTLTSPTQGLRGHVLPPSCGPQEASGYGFRPQRPRHRIGEARWQISLQGCNVITHGKGPISGHQAQPMLLQARYGRQWLVSRFGPSHFLSVLLGALKAHFCLVPRTEGSTHVLLVLRLAHPLPPLGLWAFPISSRAV